MTIRRYASILNVNASSNLLLVRYVYMLYVSMDEIIKSEYYIILYKMLHIHLRCENEHSYYFEHIKLLEVFT